MKINKIERILISPQTFHGHAKNMFAEVRRKSYQKSFSLKINAPFLNTQNGETDVCGGSGGNGGNFSAIPPQASLPPYCVIKNGVLVFMEKTLRNEFLRTFENVLECILRKSVGI